MKKYRLGDICHLQSGGTPRRSNKDYFEPGEIPWAKAGDINEEEALDETEEYISKEGLASINGRLFPKGSLFLVLYGSTLGKTCITNIESSCNQAILSINSNDEKISDNKYMKYWFDFNRQKITFKKKGGAQQNLSADYIKNLEIKLPDIALQKKVVSLLEKHRELIEKRKQTISLLSEYQQCIFLEMFLENPRYQNNNSYWQKISDVLKSSTYGTALPSNTDKKGAPVVRMNNLTYDGEIDLTSLKWVDMEHGEFARLELSDGDILFNRTNSKEMVGKTAVWDAGKGYTFAGYLVKLVLEEEKMMPDYFVAYMNSKFGKKILFNKGQSSGSQVNFSPPLLKAQQILVPPMEEQQKFSRVYNRVNKQKKALRNSLQLLQGLYETNQYLVFTDDFFEKDETDRLAEDEVRLEALLNSITEPGFSSVELYSAELERLYKILERTSKKNETDSNYKGGIIQKVEHSKIVLELNRIFKNRLADETLAPQIK